MKPAEFREQILKIMPNYKWTVHKTVNPSLLSATGTQSSGSNRCSTLRIEWNELDEPYPFWVSSAGYGLRAEWLGDGTGKTLHQALRCLQDHYEYQAALYTSHANALQQGRVSNQAKSNELVS